MAMYLVEKRADVNLMDDEHHSALHLSCQVSVLDKGRYNNLSDT